jgi:hypothetical protein
MERQKIKAQREKNNANLKRTQAEEDQRQADENQRRQQAQIAFDARVEKEAQETEQFLKEIEAPLEEFFDKTSPEYQAYKEASDRALEQETRDLIRGLEAGIAEMRSQREIAEPGNLAPSPENVVIKRDLAEEAQDVLETAREAKKLSREEWEKLVREAQATKKPAPAPGNQPASSLTGPRREIPSKEEYQRRAAVVAAALSRKAALEDIYRSSAKRLDDELIVRQARADYERSLAEYERKKAAWDQYARDWAAWDSQYPVCPKCGKRHPADWVDE